MRPASSFDVGRVVCTLAAAFLIAACGGEQTSSDEGSGVTGSAAVVDPAFVAAPTPPPVTNLVLVCIDTVRHDTFNLFDRPELNDNLSPWLDKAVRFESAVATAPWTVPTSLNSLP